MSDLQKGYTFSGTSPNNNVTAERLNALVDGASILAGFYTAKTENLSAADSDYLLIFEANSASYRKIQKGNLITQGKAKTGFCNLVIMNDPSASTTALNVTADEIVLRSADGNVAYASGFSARLDATVYDGAATADGRDFSPLADYTFYGIWAISDGTNARSLLSQAITPASTPTLPVGYLYAALLGVVRTAASATLTPYLQRGCDVAVAPASAAGVSAINQNPGINGGEFGGATAATINATPRTFTAVQLNACIPAIASRVRGMLGCTVSSTVLPNVGYALASKGGGVFTGTITDSLGMQLETVTNQSGATWGFFGVTQFDLALQTPQTLWVASSDSSPRHAMRINGYTLNL